MSSPHDFLRQVFVTGAKGFLGTHLVSALKNHGAHVTALTRTVCSLSDGVHVVEGDALDASRLVSLLATDRYDTIFHLAGSNMAAGSLALYRANVLGTATLLQAIRSLNRPEMRIIILGSSAEYGAAPDDPITEESPVVPVDDYGISKLATTRMGQLLNVTTGQAAIIARPFNLIGPGHCANLLHADVARQIVEIEAGSRQPVLKLRGLGGYRDFVDVRDVAAGLIALALHGSPGQIYNLCTERALQARLLVEYLVAQAGIAIEVQSAPMGFGDVPHQRGSFSKVKNVAGWVPLVTLEESLTDTLTYWRKALVRAPLGDPTSEAIPK